MVRARRQLCAVRCRAFRSELILDLYIASRSLNLSLSLFVCVLFHFVRVTAAGSISPAVVGAAKTNKNTLSNSPRATTWPIYPDGAAAALLSCVIVALINCYSFYKCFGFDLCYKCLLLRSCCCSWSETVSVLFLRVNIHNVCRE